MGTPKWVIWLWKNYGIKLQPTYDKIHGYQPSPEIKILLDRSWEVLLELARGGGVGSIKEIIAIIEKEIKKVK